MQVYDKKRRASLIRASKSNLAAKGWRLDDVAVKSFNYSAKKDQVSFMAECIDCSVLDCKSLSAVFEYLERQSDSFRDFGVPSIFILGEEFISYDLSSLLPRRILAVVLSGIGVVGTLDRLVNDPPANLLPFEDLFAQKSVVVANALTENYKKAGDLQEAVAWAQRAAAAAPRAAGTQQRLIELLRRQGDIAGAAAACRDALRLNPTSTGLANVMRDLAKQLGDDRLMDSIDQHMDERPKDGSATEFLLGGRPIPAAPAQNSKPSPSDDPSPADNDSKRKHVAAKFFSSLLGGRG
jgi:tetratricopeptide (TPR) repeat protein